MNEIELVSIVMPVYNPGKLLYAAIEGILNQSYRNFELICIDDASTDDSEKILLDYAKQDVRIRIYVNDENRGAAYSRNWGMKLAKGDYLLFVDADDLFEEKLLEKVMEVIRYQTPDIVYLNYNVFCEEKEEELDNRDRFYFYEDVINAILDNKDCLNTFVHDMQLAPYSRVYNKEFLTKNGLCFQQLKSSNDVYLSVMSALLAEKIAHTKEYISLVHVRKHGSKFRISNNRNPFDNYLAYQYLKSEMQRRGIWDVYARIVQEKFLSNTMYEISTCNRNLGEKYYEFLKTKGFEEMMLYETSYSKQLSPEYQDLIYFLKREKFEVGKHYKIKTFHYLIRKNEKKLLELFFWMEKNNKKYIIWGAGENGGILLEFCRKYHLKCEGAADNDKNKQGSILHGFQIYSPEEILNNISCIVICNQYYFNEIYDQILQINKKVIMISLDLYLRYKRDFFDSSFDVDNNTKYLQD